VWVPRRPRTPLFEVVGDSCSQTPITQRPGPVWVHQSGIGAALAANTDPIDAVEVKSWATDPAAAPATRTAPRPAPHAIHQHTSSTRQTRSTFPATHSATAMGMCPPGEASSWLTVSAADVPRKSRPLRQPSLQPMFQTTTAAAHVVVRRHIGVAATLSLHTSASIPSRATIGWCKAAAVRLSNGRN
jgi:hypothetical protein